MGKSLSQLVLFCSLGCYKFNKKLRFFDFQELICMTYKVGKSAPPIIRKLLTSKPKLLVIKKKNHSFIVVNQKVKTKPQSESYLIKNEI